MILSTPLDSAVFIVYDDVYILVFMIMISQSEKKIQDSLQNSAVFLLYGIHVKLNEINLKLFC